MVVPHVQQYQLDGLISVIDHIPHSAPAVQHSTGRRDKQSLLSWSNQYSDRLFEFLPLRPALLHLESYIAGIGRLRYPRSASDTVERCPRSGGTSHGAQHAQVRSRPWLGYAERVRASRQTAQPDVTPHLNAHHPAHRLSQVALASFLASTSVYTRFFKVSMCNLSLIV